MTTSHNKRKYRAVVIGCGRIGMQMEKDPKRLKPATHVGAYLHNPYTELVGVAEIDSTKQEEAREMLAGIPVFSGAAELLKKTKPDIVSIATFHEEHHPMVMLAAKHKIPAIVCEKPISDTIEKGKEMVEACEKSGSMLFVNHIRRFDPLLAEWREKVRNGVVGDIQQATGWYAIGLYHMGTHLVDFLMYYLGDIEWVSGWNNLRAHSAVPGDYCVDGILGFKNGAHAAIQSVNVKDYSMFETRILGKKGEVFIRDLGKTVELTPAKESKQYAGFFELDPELCERRTSKEQSFFKGLAENVVACLDGKSKPASTGKDALRVLEVLGAIKKSAESDGKKIFV